MSENMKPSGVAWIGDIPESWEVKKLGLLCKQIGDVDHYMPDSVDEGVPYVMTGDFIGSQNEIDFENCKKISYKDFLTLSKKIKPQKGDILFARYATIGTVRYVETDIDFLVSYACLIVKTHRNSVDGKFLYHYFFSNPFNEEVSKYINTNTQANVGSDSLNRVKISIPPIIEQTHIANFLDEQCSKIDSIVDDIEKQIEILQKYKKSLITETVTKGLDKSVPMKDSGIEWIGEIPESWISCRIKDKISTLTDYTANGSFASLAENVEYLDYEDYARVIRLTDLRVNFENAGIYVNEEAYRFLSKSALSGNEILLANVGAYAGLMCEMPKIAFRATLGPNMFLIKTIEDELLPHYLYLLSNSKLIEEELVMRATSSAQPKLNKLDVKTIAIILPPLAEQTQIANYLDQQCSKIDSIIESKKEQLTKITQHKKSLIYEYVTGKKRVKGAMDNGN